MPRSLSFRRVRAVAAVLLVAAAVVAVPSANGMAAAGAPQLTRISGAGSTWSKEAIESWAANVKANYNMTVDYAPTGSSDGRKQFRNGSVDFAVSEIPYGITDQGTQTTDPPPLRKFAYMPIVAGGTSFMYNLVIGGRRVTNLRLNGEVITKIFTRVITKWDDAAIQASNPTLSLPGRQIIPVVRADGSGTTAQFTAWMSNQYPALWNAHCQRSGRGTPCGLTSNYPYPPGAGFDIKAGSDGVAAKVAQDNAEGAITYVELAYAQLNGFPVVKVLNKAGYYVLPTRDNVAVALTHAEIDTGNPQSPTYLTQNLVPVYNDPDKRTYPLSSYSYMIVPLQLGEGGLTENKGYTLGRFGFYFLCQGQQRVGDQGYSPLPINLVRAGFNQLVRVPGVVDEDIAVENCNNPTFSGDGTNTLANNAPFPTAGDCEAAATQCPAGAGAGAGAGGGGGGGGGGTGGGTTTPAASAGANVDPDTGEVLADGDTNDGANQLSYVDGKRVDLAAEDGWSVRHTIMALAAGLLLGLVIGPPLLSFRLRSRGGRGPA